MSNQKTPRNKTGKLSRDLTPDAIAAKRDAQLAALEKMRASRGQLEGCAKNAYLMLTRGWGRASWHVRAELLKASTWLLYVDSLRNLWPDA
jgi:hypothetical protein